MTSTTAGPRSRIGALLFVALLAQPAANAFANGLWDAGLLHGGWRSDYADADTGTARRPLTYSWQCPFPATPFAICPANFQPILGVPGPQPARGYSRSNWVDARRGLEDYFWLVSANVEPALDPTCNSGPPNQSEAVVAPFEGVFGVAVRPAAATGQPYRNEVVLAVDLSHRPRQLETRPDCQVRDFIPYLGFGMYSGRGGGDAPLAMLGHGQAAPALRFDYRLVDSNAEFFGDGDAVPSAPRGQYAGLLIEAQWGARKRWVWIDLLKAYGRHGPTSMTPWNWTVRESFYYPGAEIVLTSGEALRAECGADGFELPPIAPDTYAHRRALPVRLDLQRLYQCVGARFSTPFAAQAQPVPVTGVQFFVEVGVREHDGLPGLSAADYDSRLGVAIAGVDIVPRDGGPLGSDAAFVAQLGRDLLGREWTASERTHWHARIAAVGRSAMAAEALRSQPVRRTAVAAARMGLVAFGHTVERRAYDAALARLRAGEPFAAAAEAIAASDAFTRSTAVLGEDAFVRLMYRRALGAELAGHADAAAIAERFGSVAYWTAALREGRATRAAVLLNAFRLAAARNLLATEAEVVVSYRAFLGLLPDSGGVGYWRGVPDMPERLLEVLYHTSEYRGRFTD